MTWVWAGIYAIGFVTMARYMILDVQDCIDSANFEIRKTNETLRKKDRLRLAKWDALDVGLVFLVSTFWVLVAAFYVAKFLMFPRGVKSKFAREQEQVAKAKEAEERLAKAEEELRKMQDEVLRYVPHNFPICMAAVSSSVDGPLTSCGRAAVTGTERCAQHLAEDVASRVEQS